MNTGGRNIIEQPPGMRNLTVCKDDSSSGSYPANGGGSPLLTAEQLPIHLAFRGLLNLLAKKQLRTGTWLSAFISVLEFVEYIPHLNR
jgi:hypothetical protein